MPTTTLSPTLARLNTERSLGLKVGPLQYDERDILQGSEYAKLPVCTVDDYRQKSVASEAWLDDDRTPYLVVKEALELGVHPLVEVLEVDADLVRVGSGVRFGRQSMVRVDMLLGVGLVPPQSVLVWRR